MAVPDKPTIDGLEDKWSARWEADGTFRFDDLSTGTYDVLVAAEGKGPKLSKRVRVESGGVKDLGNLELGAPSILRGKLLVDGAVGLARSAGMSERLVGLTIVAIGTSLPELAASLVAASRGQPSIAVGNVVGSNVFNVLAILGVAALVRPLEVQLGALAADVGWLAGLTLAASVFLRTARVLRRSEGVLLILGYVGFLVTLILRR